jgi:hypothetical protein
MHSRVEVPWDYLNSPIGNGRLETGQLIEVGDAVRKIAKIKLTKPTRF